MIEAPTVVKTEEAVPAPESFAAFEAAKRAEIRGEAPPVKEEPPKEEVPETPSEAPEEPEAKTEPESDPGDEEPVGEEKPAKKGGFQRRIDKLTARNRELEAELARQRAAQPAEQPKAEAKDAGKPKVQDFDSLEEWEEAVAGWRENKRSAESAKQQAQTAHQALVDRFNSSMNEARSVHPDFDEVLADVDVMMQPAAGQALMEAEKSGELVYWLAQNPAEAQRIAGMSYGAASREFGKIEAKLTTPKPKANVKVSQAPKPPASVAARATPISNDPADAVSFADYERLRRAQILAQRR